MTPKERFSEDLKELIDSRDVQRVWTEYTGLDITGLTKEEQLEFSQQLFEEPWHQLHNELAYEFQRAAHPATAEWIFNQVANGKIPELEYKPISRVFTWALACIGSQEAWEYLQKIAAMGNKDLEIYARKRLAGWTSDKMHRTITYPVNGWSKERLPIEGYHFFRDRLPSSGRHIVAYHTEDEITLYQAYNHQIADWAVANQKLGGSAFSYNRMSWIKPNFLWMMYRCGWASKENQERVLAITISKKDWEEILSQAVFSSYQSDIYRTEASWKKQLALSEVRLQWDPAHDPYGAKLERKAIQIGMKGGVLRKFGTEMIRRIDDVTEFVKWQKLYVDQNDLGELVVPEETVYLPCYQEINIGLSKWHGRRKTDLFLEEE
jgi:hypothetical protein